MLKDELDFKVRKYNTNFPDVKLKVNTERVEKDANRVWKKLRKLFLRHCCQTKDLNILVGICNNPYDPGGTGHVYYKLPCQTYCRRLVFRKVKHISATIIAVREKAQNEGIFTDLSHTGSIRSLSTRPRLAFWNTFTYIQPSE